MRTDELAEAIGARLEGEARPARALVAPDAPVPGAVAVVEDDTALRQLLAHPAAAELAAVVVAEAAHVPANAPPLLRHASPRLALARVSRLLDATSPPPPGVHDTADVAGDAQLGAGVSIGAHAVVGRGARIGDGSVLDAGAVVGDDCVLGREVRLFPGVVLYHGVHLGDRVRVHAGAVLGADGFGYAPGPHGAEKIHHLGTVRIGDDVEIGAHTCIDRATFGATEIGDGTKIDNLCQIGHNVRIGRGCLIAGTCAVGGSSVLEDRVVLGGGAAVSDHVRIGPGAQIGGRAGVTKDVPAEQRWGGLPAQPVRGWARERYLIGQLEKIWAHVRTSRR